MTIQLSRLFLMAALLSPLALSAQQSLRQKLSDEFCQALTQKNLPDKWDDKTLETIGLLIIPVVANHKEEIQKELGLSMEDQEDYRAVGEIIGQEAALTCPKFRKMMEQMIENSGAPAEAAETLEGTYLGQETNGSFVYLRIKGTDGREQKVWWFSYFPGSEKLEEMKKKPVVIQYIEQEVYEPNVKDYVKIKVVKSMEKG